MPLYRGTVTMHVYFWSEEDDGVSLEQDAKDRMESIVANNGLPVVMSVRRASATDPIAEGWEDTDLVPGTEDVTDGERMTLHEALGFAKFREAPAKAKAKVRSVVQR